LIHFDFDDRYRDELIVGNAMSRREGALLSLVSHVSIVAALLLLPQLPMFQSSAEDLRRAEELQAQIEQRERENRNRTFVFVQPKADFEAPKPPPRAAPSDKNRVTSSPLRMPNATNREPLSRGTSPQFTEPSQMARGNTPQMVPDPAPRPGPTSSQEIPRPLPPAESGYSRPQETGRVGGSALGEALKNLERYAQNETFNNPQGGATQPGADIQFDTKGVEFGPWIRRFVAQVKRNWFVPQAAWIQRGHVVLQFNIHKDGHITDLAIVKPSAVDAFNKAAYNAMLSSNPTEPLPPEYPSDKALFTVTFYYNESPPPF
jgi:TonB family protein